MEGKFVEHTAKETDIERVAGVNNYHFCLRMLLHEFGWELSEDSIGIDKDDVLHLEIKAIRKED